MAEKIRIKAGKDAPDFVAHGYLQAKKVNGHFVTTSRVFADHIIASGLGIEATKNEGGPAKAKTKSKAKPKVARPETKTAATAEENSTGGTE